MNGIIALLLWLSTQLTAGIFSQRKFAGRGKWEWGRDLFKGRGDLRLRSKMVRERLEIKGKGGLRPFLWPFLPSGNFVIFYIFPFLPPAPAPKSFIFSQRRRKYSSQRSREHNVPTPHPQFKPSHDWLIWIARCTIAPISTLCTLLEIV